MGWGQNHSPAKLGTGMRNSDIFGDQEQDERNLPKPYPIANPIYSSEFQIYPAQNLPHCQPHLFKWIPNLSHKRLRGKESPTPVHATNRKSLGPVFKYISKPTRKEHERCKNNPSQCKDLYVYQFISGYLTVAITFKMTSIYEESIHQRWHCWEK